jgi:ATP-dependent helicase/nuclease subunit B
MNKILCSPGIYTIPAGIRFLPSLAYGIYDGYEDCPHLLSNINIFLPTKRSCRVLRESFLETSGGKSLVLPKMQTFGDHDTDELDISIDTLSSESLDISRKKEPIPSTKRHKSYKSFLIIKIDRIRP